MKSIIEVSHLSKKYRYGESQPYYTLRDTLAGLVKNPFQILNRDRRQNALDKGEFWALKDVSFKVNTGEVIGIIGSNGAGKSTLLKILSRITPPTLGKVILRGRVGSLLEVGTGFQQELTGRENIYLNGAILGMSKHEINRKFDEIVDFSGVEKFIDTPVKHYSTGMYMRLAFAVAAHLDSEILVVDEVLAVGDTEFQKKCLGKMQDISNESGRTILFVSHNLNSITSLCSKSILLDRGVIKSIGKTDKVIREYTNIVRSVADSEIGKRRDRHGNGKIRFTNIYIKNRSSPTKSTIIAGEGVDVEVHYKVFDKSIKDFDFYMAIDTFAEQYRLATITNKVFGRSLPTNKNVIRLSINRLPLAAGKYSYNLIMVDKLGEIVDWLVQAGTFEVVGGDYYGAGQTQNFDGNLLLDYKIEK